MAWTIAAIVLVCTIGGLWYGARRTHHVPLDRLRVYLDMLLRRGYRGAFMIAWELDGSRRGPRFIQFAKYIAAPGQIGIEFSFPLSEWSRDCYQLVKTLLQERGLEYRIERTGRPDTTEFVSVDFGRDVDTASRIARSVLQEVFGISNGGRVFLEMQNVSPHDELIDGRVTR